MYFSINCRQLLTRCFPEQVGGQHVPALGRNSPVRGEQPGGAQTHKTPPLFVIIRHIILFVVIRPAASSLMLIICSWFSRSLWRLTRYVVGGLNNRVHKTVNWICFHYHHHHHHLRRHHHHYHHRLRHEVMALDMREGSRNN